MQNHMPTGRMVHAIYGSILYEFQDIRRHRYLVQLLSKIHFSHKTNEGQKFRIIKYLAFFLIGQVRAIFLVFVLYYTRSLCPSPARSGRPASGYFCSFCATPFFIGGIFGSYHNYLNYLFM